MRKVKDLFSLFLFIHCYIIIFKEDLISNLNLILALRVSTSPMLSLHFKQEKNKMLSENTNSNLLFV